MGLAFLNLGKAVFEYSFSCSDLFIKLRNKITVVSNRVESGNVARVLEMRRKAWWVYVSAVNNRVSNINKTYFLP